MKKGMKLQGYNRRVVWATCLTLSVVIFPNISMAYYITGVETAIAPGFCKVMLALQGTVGKIIASMAVMATGFYYLYTYKESKRSWVPLIVLVVGIVTIRFADNITDAIAGPIIPYGTGSGQDNTYISCAGSIADQKLGISSGELYYEGQRIVQKLKDVSRESD